MKGTKIGPLALSAGTDHTGDFLGWCICGSYRKRPFIWQIGIFRTRPAPPPPEVVEPRVAWLFGLSEIVAKTPTGDDGPPLFLPIGAIVDKALITEGYVTIPCDGREFEPKLYPELAAALFDIEWLPVGRVPDLRAHVGVVA